MKRKTRVYDKQYKLNAVRLYLESGESYKAISKKLDIPDRTLATWVENFKKDGDQSFPGKGKLKPSDEEIMALKRELQIAREERDILKKALGVFSLHQK